LTPTSTFTATSDPTINYLPGKITITKALTNIHEPVKIALPASYPNLAIEPGFPLPSGTKLDHLDIFGKASQYFYYTQASAADFKAFFQNLAPINGWTVEKIGPLESNSYSCDLCVILSNGKEKSGLFGDRILHILSSRFLIRQNYKGWQTDRLSQLRQVSKSLFTAPANKTGQFGRAFCNGQAI
jgi:hypothetical protein